MDVFGAEALARTDNCAVANLTLQARKSWFAFTEAGLVIAPALLATTVTQTMSACSKVKKTSQSIVFWVTDTIDATLCWTTATTGAIIETTCRIVASVLAFVVI